MDNLPKQAVMLMITSQDWGGAQLYVFELAKELKARGEEVIVVAGSNGNPLSLRDISFDKETLPKRPLVSAIGGSAYGGKGGYSMQSIESGDLSPLVKEGHLTQSVKLGDFRPGHELGQRCREEGINFIELKNVARDINPIANLLSVIELIKLFRQLKPRVVHLNSTMMGVVGSLAATLTRVPKRIYCIGGWVFNEDLPTWKKNLYIWIERLSARWKDVIIVVHPGDEELAKKLKIEPQKKLVTIPNGIAIEEFESKLLSRNEAREKLGIDPEAIIIGNIANAYPPKNLFWYLEVCKKIHDADKRICFVIIGEGPQFADLKKKRDALGAGSYVMLAGRRMDAPTLYKAFDLFVLPSSKEGMSITLLEAMAAKVPIVATDVGAAKWMLGSGGVIVPSGNADAMQSAILDLVFNSEKQKNISQMAHEMLLNNFDLQKLFDSTIEIINQ